MTELFTPVLPSIISSSNTPQVSAESTKEFHQNPSTAGQLVPPALKPCEFTTASFRDWKANGCPDQGYICVQIADIALDERLQVRKCTYPNTVKRYLEAMEAGKSFPAVTVACIDGVLFLVDGWHRLSACSQNMQQWVGAVVSTMTYDQAKWAAAEANMNCGLPLRDTEVREAFHAFMEAKMYRKGHTWLSYREIGALLGKPHTTIRNWMQKYYPRIFNRYKQIDPSMKYVKGTDAERTSEAESADTPFNELLHQVHVAIDNTKNMAKSLDPHTLGKIIERIREALREIEDYPHHLPEF